MMPLVLTNNPCVGPVWVLCGSCVCLICWVGFSRATAPLTMMARSTRRSPGRGNGSGWTEVSRPRCRKESSAEDGESRESRAGRGEAGREAEEPIWWCFTARCHWPAGNAGRDPALASHLGAALAELDAAAMGFLVRMTQPPRSQHCGGGGLAQPP